jgi:hypothetical protein
MSFQTSGITFVSLGLTRDEVGSEDALMLGPPVRILAALAALLTPDEPKENAIDEISLR